MNYLNSLAPTSRILSNEIKTISKLVEGEGEGEGNICTNKILGSLEILAIKKLKKIDNNLYFILMIDKGEY